MKLWMVFVVLTVLCWGAYVPTLHHGQTSFGSRGPLRAFLFVALAYVLVASYVLIHLFVTIAEPLEFPSRAVGFSTFAGLLGAIGAIGIVFAMRHGGSPLLVAPLVFAGAPIVNTLVSMLWSRPAKPPSVMFYVGIALAAVGASLVLRFKPT